MLEELFITLPELPSQEAVQAYAVKHPSFKPKHRKDPFWVVVCVMVGAALSVGAGAYLITLGAVR